MNLLEKRPFLPRHSFTLAAICLSLLLILGCGSGDYDRKMKETLSNLESGNSQALDRLLHNTATSIPGTPISFRLPARFDTSSLSMSMSPQENGMAIDPNRVQPPFTKLPGFRFSYEKWVQDDSGTELPIYCYIAAAAAASTSPDAIMSQIQREMKTAVPQTPDSWETVELESTDGNKLSCRRISVVGEQRFDRRSKGGPNSDREGRFDAYLHTAGSFHLIIAFRAPTSIPQQEQFFQTVEASFASLKF